MNGLIFDRELICADGEFHMRLEPDDDAEEMCDVIDGPFLGCGPHSVRPYRHLSAVQS